MKNLEIAFNLLSRYLIIRHSFLTIEVVMLIIPGGRALSDFNQSKLLRNIHGVMPSVESVDARYQHFVDVSEDLNEQSQQRLESLLNYGEEAFDDGQDGVLFLVTPRPGTISPWSSKATDIVHNCGLLGVKRVERATAYYIAEIAQEYGVRASRIAREKPIAGAGHP